MQPAELMAGWAARNARHAFLCERENVRHAAVNNDIVIGMRALFPQAG